MQEMTIVCRDCGDTHVLPAGRSFRACPACGTVNGRPRVSGEPLDRLRRANQQRRMRDFRNAEVSYQSVLRVCPEEHEALWGLALCRYRVQHVRDPRTRHSIPLVHGLPEDLQPMQLDSDFLLACEYAPENVCEQYQMHAGYVDSVITRARAMAEGEGYDIYICQDQAEPDTPAYRRGLNLAHALAQAGRRVFFAPEALRDMEGPDYAAGIFHALSTAKVMLLLCEDARKLTSPWMQADWWRFLRMCDVQREKRLLPLLCAGVKAEMLPDDFTKRRLPTLCMDAEDGLEAVYSALGLQRPAVPVEPLRAGAALPRVQKLRETAETEVKYRAPRCIEDEFSVLPAPGGCMIDVYRGQGGSVVVPARIRGVRVMQIGKHAFENRVDLTGVTLPEGLTHIGAWAFHGCSALRRVDMPGSVTGIGECAFWGCAELLTITIPRGVTRIESWCFADCASLRSVALPAGVVSIGAGAFRECRNLMYADMSEDLTSIGMGAFSGCVSLRRMKLPAGVLSIGIEAFSGCPGLKLSVSESSPAHRYALACGLNFVARRQEKAPEKPAEPVQKPAERVAPQRDFRTELVAGGCRLIHYSGPGGDVVIPSCLGGVRVVAIGGAAFKSCGKLQSVVIPEGVTVIGSMAFWFCTSLRRVELPSTLRRIDYGAFSHCRELRGVRLPDVQIKIDAQAFTGCPEDIFR